MPYLTSGAVSNFSAYAVFLKSKTIQETAAEVRNAEPRISRNQRARSDIGNIPRYSLDTIDSNGRNHSSAIFKIAPTARTDQRERSAKRSAAFIAIQQIRYRDDRERLATKERVRLR